MPAEINQVGQHQGLSWALPAWVEVILDTLPFIPAAFWSGGGLRATALGPDAANHRVQYLLKPFK